MGRVLTVAIGAVTVFAFTLVATPAHAADPTAAENFNPDEVPATHASLGTETMVMSDRNDGTNTTFHVNTVASNDTGLVQWYYCPSAYAGTDPTAGGSGCTLAGQDTSAETITPAAPDSDAEAYEMDFNVPDDALHDWVAWVCSQTPATDANCFQEKENDVQFDDASTGTPESQSPAGEITSPANPSHVSNTGFTATATTDPSVTEVAFCYVNSADEDEDPTTCNVLQTDNTPNNPPAQQTTFKTWSATVDPGDNGDGALVLFESAGGATSSLPGGSVNCTGDTADCQLDSHYIGAAAPTPTTATLSFPQFDEAPNPPDGNCDEDFTAPGGPVNTAEDAATSFADVQGCLFDQSGNLITNNHDWAFQVTPTDPDANAGDTLGFSGTDAANDEGDENDTNGDFFFEQVDGDPGPAGNNSADEDVPTNIANQELEIDSAGTYNVLFCRDSDNNAEDGASQSATPCNGESVSASGTLEVTPIADHVHVKRQGTEGALCHTGSSSVTAAAGSVVNLVGCALNTAPDRAEQGAPNTHVLWIVNPAGNPGDPGQISSQENNTDSSGKADASITSGAGAAGKTTTVRFCRDEFPFGGDGNGICDAVETNAPAGLPDPALQADFQINWTQAAQQPTDDACAKAKKRVRRLRQKLNQAKAAGNDDKVKRLKRRLRRAKIRRARACR